MVKKIPNIGYRIILSDLLSGFIGFFSKSYTNDFQKILSEYAQSKHIYLTNSGISAFYLVLQALKKRSSRREVILPGYTAPSLVVAIHKAGLKPVLCDISLEDFNMDTKTVRGMVSSETLCVVCVHMFGIPVKNIEHFNGRHRRLRRRRRRVNTNNDIVILILLGIFIIFFMDSMFKISKKIQK